MRGLSFGQGRERPQSRQSVITVTRVAVMRNTISLQASDVTACTESGRKRKREREKGAVHNCGGKGAHTTKVRAGLRGAKRAQDEGREENARGDDEGTMKANRQKR